MDNTAINTEYRPNIINTDSLSEHLDIRTNIGKSVLSSELDKWSPDINKCKIRSQQIRAIRNSVIKNKNTKENITNIFEKIKSIEPVIEDVINKQSNLEKEAQSELLFTSEWNTCFNFIPYLLPFWALLRVYILPGLSVLLPLLSIILPYIIIRYVIGQNMDMPRYMELIKTTFMKSCNMPFQMSSAQGCSDNGSLFNHIKSVGQIVWIVGTLIQTIIQPYWTYEHLSNVDSILIKKGESLIQLKHLYNELRDILNIHGIQLMKYPLNHIECPRQALAYALLHPVYIKLALKTIGSIDILFALASSNDICYTQFVDSSEPILYLHDTFDYAIALANRKTFSVRFDSKSSHVLLTGPNKGGKSTVLRAIAYSLLLSHTYGCAFGKKCQVSLFDKLYVSLQADDLPGKQSRFERELLFTKETLKYTNQKRFIIIDELYHTTNPPDAEQSCQIYCNKLWNDKNTCSIISTHLHDFVEMTENGNVCKMCCPAILKDDDTIEYSYTYRKGICTVSSVKDCY